MADHEDRTEAATPKRLTEAREQGNVPLSPELAPLLLFGGVAGLAVMAAPLLLARAGRGLAALMLLSGRLDGPEDLGFATARAAAIALPLLGAVGGLALAAAAAGSLVQTGMLLNFGALLPDLARLDPRRGFRRVFGLAHLMLIARAVLKAGVVGAALWRLFSHRLMDLAGQMLAPASALPGKIESMVAAVLVTATIAQGTIAVLDVLLARLRHARSLRMSREELRQEAREMEGNPEVKAKLRRIRTQRARYRIAHAVKHATVVVTNPTHYAVALAYDRTRNAAPRVVAKGMDEMAARIRALAEENDVPLVANPPLARALHRLDVDTEVPPDLYKAVAELIAYVWRLRGAARPV